MTLPEYIPLAIRTESTKMDPTPENRLLHAAIGVSTEAAELMLAPVGDRTNFKEELGDLCWYAAIIADVVQKLGMSIPYHACHACGTGIDQLRTTIVVKAGDVLDQMKKVWAYGAPLTQERVTEIVSGTRAILTAVNECCLIHGWTISSVLEANIRKLQARYPEKFETTAALVRDLPNERDALEGVSHA